ncbi:MAG: DNA translocase FtsK 4TM domain-containing protein, partial [Bryocella sp.]
MKPQRLTYAPTRSRRLNEMLGLVVLVVALLTLLALVSYTPSDPSFNTASAWAGTRPAQNWTGLVGAYSSDLMLQVLGVSVLFIPLVLLRLGFFWVHSKAVGSALAKSMGLLLWLLFAPAAIALLPGHLLWRHALPIAGVEGRLLADAMVHLLNLPGTIALCGLMVALSIYLSTTFLLTTAREWFATHVAPFRAMRAWWQARKDRRADKRAQATIAAYESKREKEALASDVEEHRKHSLLGSFFARLGRRKAVAADASETAGDRDRASFGEDSPSVWDGMPRVQATDGVASPLAAATAAAAPFAAKLAAAAAPELQLPFGEPEEEAAEEENWIDS